MADKKFVVPEGMLAAAISVGSFGFDEPGRAADLRRRLEAALRWLSENPIVPTKKQVSDMWTLLLHQGEGNHAALIAEWQRRMFLAPEPEVPEEIKDLLYLNPEHDNSRVIEAYRRGKESAQKGQENGI